LKQFLRIPLLVLLLFGRFSTEGFSADFYLNRVIDGDTLEVEDAKGNRMQIDLVGIDAPEMEVKNRVKGQPFSQKAQKELSTMIFNKPFSYRAHGFTARNHVLAVVYSEGKNINLEMLKAGLAEVYRGKLPQGFNIAPYKAAEKQAKESDRGIWSLGSVYISPIDWRRANPNSF
jgi:endonuclease YncB( thermonuclease family)